MLLHLPEGALRLRCINGNHGISSCSRGLSHLGAHVDELQDDDIEDGVIGDGDSRTASGTTATWTTARSTTASATSTSSWPFTPAQTRVAYPAHRATAGLDLLHPASSVGAIHPGQLTNAELHLAARRCQQADCDKGAAGSTNFCKAHGGVAAVSTLRAPRARGAARASASRMEGGPAASRLTAARARRAAPSSRRTAAGRA
jgi:hypothetical protein